MQIETLMINVPAEIGGVSENLPRSAGYVNK